MSQYPEDHDCDDCGDVADEWYDDHWLCEECILKRQEKEDL